MDWAARKKNSSSLVLGGVRIFLGTDSGIFQAKVALAVYPVGGGGPVYD